LKEKEEGAKKINIRSSILEDFLKHCRANIASAQSHLEDEKKRAEEEREDQEIRRRATEIAQQEAQLREAIRKSEEAAKQEERDQKAEAMMRKVDDLRSGWQHEQAAADAAKAKRSKVVENQELEEEDNQQVTRGLFDDSDDESDMVEPALNDVAETNPVSHGDLFGDTDSEDDVEPATKKTEITEQIADDDSDDDVEFDGGTKKADLTNDLFGDTDDSDEELIPTGSKRGHDEPIDDEDTQDKKKQRLNEDDEE
jgi:hypothetical protein